MTIIVPSLRAIACAPGWVRNDLWRRARAVPSLDLRFADSKSLVDAISGQNLVTFTRSSGGTYVDSAGVLRTAANDEPRFDHNPTTGECLGLLVEEQRTNLQINSENPSATGWTPSGTTVSAGAAVSPASTPNAAKLVVNTSNVPHHIEFSSTVTASTQYVASIFLKAGEESIAVLWNNVSGGVATFNLLNGTLVSGTGTITSFGNGWYRCSIGYTPSGTSGQVRVYVRQGTAYTGNGTSGIYIWGAQLEVGAFPTSYIPTTTSAATRAADVASIAGTSFSSWYRQDEGTVFASGDFANAGAAGFSRVVSLTGENTGTDEISLYTRISIGAGDGSIFGAVTVNSSLQGDLNSPIGSPILSGGYRSAIAYKANDFGLSSNGLTPTTDTSGTLPTITQLIIMGNVRFQNRLSGHIRRLTYFPARLPDATLQAITQ